MTEYRRQQALAWLKEEADRCRRAPVLNGCQMKPEWEDMIENCEAAIEALEAVGRSEKCESD